jgi:Rieske Fe-S protein
MKLNLVDEKAEWREQFPVNWADDEYRSRRDFTRLLGLTSLAFVVGQLWIIARDLTRRAKEKPLPVAIARADDVPVGGFKLFYYPGQNDPCVLVRLAQNDWVAFEQKCTHLSCPVIPQPQQGRFFCPCHEGVFDIATGERISGPPRRPLVRVAVTARAGQVYATGVEPGEV